MYDFINSLREKSRYSTSLFMIGLDQEDKSYTFKLLESIYQLKKDCRKLNSKKFDFNKNKMALNYINTVSLFSLRLNYTHMIFSVLITIVVTNRFDENISSFGFLTNNKKFKDIFDTTEQELLIKFNQFRNIVVHTPFLEMFLDFTKEDFESMQDLVIRLIELEKVIFYELRKQSFFSPHSHG